jgi:hypothetical protein
MGSGWNFLLKLSEMASNIYLKFTQRKDLVPLFWSSQIHIMLQNLGTVPLIEQEMMNDPHLCNFWDVLLIYIDTTIILKLYNEYITIYILSYSVIVYAYMHEEIAFDLTADYKNTYRFRV